MKKTIQNTILTATILVLGTVLGAGLLGGCKADAMAEDEAACLAPKPGTIVTVNQYCAVVGTDPVDPEIMTEWKGQKVGFCCKGCVPKWEKMTAAQKDSALAKAVAKGKIPV